MRLGSVWKRQFEASFDDRELEHGQEVDCQFLESSPDSAAFLSPLLANVYMRRFLKAWELRGNDRGLGCRVVNYADDCVPGSCVRDEGRPLAAGLQDQAANRLKLLWSRARAVRVKEKARQDRVR